MKSQGLFHFKQFSVSHERSTHKIGTDAVLLGAWVKTGNAKRILDIGTGSGVIALMLAQKSSAGAQIDAVELDQQDVEQAKENVSNSPWPSKVIVHHTAVQDFFPERKYDLIVSNPPYFVNSWLPPDEKRGKARHTQELSFDKLLSASVRLLDESGKLAVILPYKEGQTFVELARSFGLILARQLTFQSRKHKPIERLMLEFQFQESPTSQEHLILHDDGEAWSADYRNLTKDFYLKA
jgi:tRNA1Val (adenine37-N6)-methyltransferase